MQNNSGECSGRSSRRRDSLRFKDSVRVGGFPCQHSAVYETVRPCYRRARDPVFLSRRSGCLAFVPRFADLRNEMVGGESGRQGAVLLSGRRWCGGSRPCPSDCKDPCLSWSQEQAKGCSSRSEESDYCGSFRADFGTGKCDPCFIRPASAACREADPIRAQDDGWHSSSCTSPPAAIFDSEECEISNASYQVPARVGTTSQDQEEPLGNSTCSSNAGGRTLQYFGGRGPSFESRGPRPDLQIFVGPTTSFDNADGAHCFSRWTSGLRPRRICLFELIPQRLSKEGTPHDRVGLPKGEFHVEGISKRLQKVETIRTGPGYPARLSGEIPVYQVSGKTGRFCGPKRLGPDDVAPGMHCRSDGGWRPHWSSGDDGFDPCSFGTSCPGQRALGSGLPPDLARGPSSWSVHVEASEHEPHTQSFCAPMSSRMGHNDFVLCEGGRPDKLPPSRGGPKEGPAIKAGRQGGSSQEKEAKIPCKAKGRPRRGEVTAATLHANRSSVKVPAKVLFLLPIPKENVFEGQTSGGSRCRRKRAFDQAFHVVVMALNFWHSDYRFVPLKELTKVPSPEQWAVLQNLRRILKAYGSCDEEFSVPSSGRRSTNLLSQLADLCEFQTWQGGPADSYFHGFPGADGGYQEAKVTPKTDRAEELRPYRSLDASRLKLTGTASWDPTPFLSDDLWLAYVEPKSLRWRDSPEGVSVPDLAKEDPEEVQKLARVWDVNGLLHINAFQEEETDTAMRFFNCYKNQHTDRMIGDRRAMNACEGTIPGASRALPSAMHLACLEVDPKCEKLSICISDRKDFYHQFKVSPQRAASNLCFPPVKASELADTKAFAAWTEKNLKKNRKAFDRFAEGDFLGSSKPKWLDTSDPNQLVSICFASVPQGDHLGVEFAVSSHRALLFDHGLLHRDSELRADRLFRGSKNCSGLVIDDFYAVAVVESSERRSDEGWAVGQFKIAQDVYAAQGLIGSSEKDVIDADKAKVTGGDLDSSEALRKLGICSLASPVQKRLSLSLVSLELARLRSTTDSLHLCLLGGWVHSLLYRRPMMSLLDEVFRLADALEVSQEAPRVIPLPRKVAQELTMLAVLAPMMMTDLSASMSDEVYATDSSDLKGAIVKTKVPRKLARALWRSSRKKGGYVRMLTKTEALIKKLDPDHDESILAEPAEKIQKPLALRFHFIEICGGAGKVSRFLSQKGWVTGPIIDLDRSEHFNLRGLRLLSWILHLLESGLLDAFMVQPPCTTFSPAQYPASRSYQRPRGHDPTDEKTLLGTTLAIRSLTLIHKGGQIGSPGLLEQPKRTKMRKLEEWQRLIELGLAYEETTASCMFGSPHLKEFVFLVCGMDASAVHRKCSKDHDHVRIEGRFTKDSAIYVDKLAQSLADCFDAALAKKLRLQAIHDDKPSGLENPLCNEVLLSSSWKVQSVWRWKRPRHINIQETGAVLSLEKKLALTQPKTSFVCALDSNVGLCSLVKGRSSSNGLRPVLRKVGATVVAGCLYSGYHFAPTRWNPADHPTRDHDMPPPSKEGIAFQDAPLEALVDFAENECLTRPYANWVRLFSVLCPGPYAWQSEKESWRFRHHSLKHFPFGFCTRPSIEADHPLEFDSTKGFPGEGPSVLCLWIYRLLFVSSWCVPVSWISPSCPHLFPVLFITLFVAAWTLSRSLFARLPVRSPFSVNHRGFQPTTSLAMTFPCSSSFRGAGLLGRVVLCCALFSCAHAVSHGVLKPRDAGDKRRAETRGELDLPEGRPVLGRTQGNRDKLLALFDEWLQTKGFSLSEMLFVAEPDIETLNIQLERYGRELFRAGRPYGHYSETINAVSGKRPRVRRALQPAWDLAYSWMRQEPPTHHVALPWQVLAALITTALVWGWPLAAGILALSWGGLTRIGEALGALRSQLVLPCDVEYTTKHVMLQINEPKTRFRAARHQIAKLDQPQLVKVVELAFQHLKGHQKLWPFSGQTMRLRFQKLLEANKLDKIPRHLAKGLDLGSLRAGGASWLMLVSEDSELTRRRGRWLNNKIM